MSFESVQSSVIFALQMSLIDLIKRQIPNYMRGTSLNLSQTVNDAYQLYTVNAYHPAFLEDTSAIYLEPAGVNLVSDNTDFASNVWVRGSNNISVLPDVDLSPIGTYRADRVRWDRGQGSSQVFKRSLTLEPGTTYTAQWAIALYGGEPSASDVIRVTGDVAEGNEQISLGVLEPYPQKMRHLVHQFTTGGKLITSDQLGEEGEDYSIVSVTATTVTIEGWEVSTGVDDLATGLIFFDEGDEGLSYEIVSNTAINVSSGTITFTLNATNLVADGISISNKVLLSKAPKQDVNLEIYVESTLSLSLGFVDVKEKDFPTSPILQLNEIEAKSDTSLVYRKSPLAGLENFSLFFDIQEWRGDGSIVDIDNISLSIENGKLKVDVEAVTILSDLPKKEVRILLVVSSEQRKVELYINNKLEASRTLTQNVFGALDAQMSLGADGVRIIRRVTYFNIALTNDQVIEEGDMGTGDVVLVFTNPNIISTEDISSRNPSMTVGALEIPAKSVPELKTKITSVNTATRTLTVLNSTNLSADDPVLIVRETMEVLDKVEKELFYRIVESVTGNNVVLDSVSGIKINDYLILGDYNQPGIASIRFEVDPIDLQEIEVIDEVNKTIELSTVAAFYIGSAYVRNELYQEVAEILIKEKDEIAQTITVNDLIGISQGNVIMQPESEMLISPENYFVVLKDTIDKVSLPKKFLNGVSFENYNDYPVTIEPIITVNL